MILVTKPPRGLGRGSRATMWTAAGPYRVEQALTVTSLLGAGVCASAWRPFCTRLLSVQCVSGGGGHDVVDGRCCILLEGVLRRDGEDRVVGEGCHGDRLVCLTFMVTPWAWGGWSS
jgi:hypothetical protein